MVLYIDETENTDYFIVTGLLMESKIAADRAYAKFKKQAQNVRIPDDKKAMLFTEFKSGILDHKYKGLKNKLLMEIISEEPTILYSCYIKKGNLFSQEYKEDTYLTLVAKIVSSIKDNISVVYDRFQKPDFEDRINKRVLTYSNIESVCPKDSQVEAGLQLVDNICSVIRLYKSGQDRYGFYEIIEKYVVEL